MNTKRMTARIATATALLAISIGANANDRPFYDYAKVISAKPIISYVNVRTPVRECWQDTEYYTAYDRRRGSAGSTLAGAIIGGVIGHQFGSGHGKDAATIAGSMIGAAIGHGPVHRTQYSRPVERCRTSYRNEREQRIDGYEVLYKYRGQKYATTMPYNPGKKLKIRVDIRPTR
jgi:uncharacterized protein YcfJ